MMGADSALARLQRLMAENGQRPQQAAAGGNPRGSRGGARASGAGGAASAAGTAPGSFGAFRGSSVPFMVHAHELEKVFNPTGFVSEWTFEEIMRVSVALPTLSLPFDPERPGQTIVALDKAIFEAGLTDDTFPLVDADVANGNAGFVLKGDVTDPLDYHLWVLSLLLQK